MYVVLCNQTSVNSIDAIQNRLRTSPIICLHSLPLSLLFISFFRLSIETSLYSFAGLLTNEKDKQMTFKEAKTLTKQTTIGLFEVMAFFESCHTNDSSLRSFFISRRESVSLIATINRQLTI